MKLLVVDDSKIIRNKIESLTADMSNIISEIISAQNGKEALELFQQIGPDIITMDITMPEMGGIECIEKITNINDQTLILVISALNDKETAIEALKKGAHGFLCKPFTDRELGNALEILFRKKIASH